MKARTTAALVGAVVMALAATTGAAAQTLGTFRWQLQPFCNVVAVTVTQVGAVYRLEGTDDQCGAGADAASVTGTAFQNPDGTIGFGLNIVTTPGGAPVHVDAAITIATLSGTWRDSAGANGLFVLTPGAGTGGSARPLPSPSVPLAIQLRTDGGVLATGTDGVGTIPASGDGVRMMWYPGKAAFRAGEASGTTWDDANVGQRSTAFGVGTTASGFASVAMGVGAHASGDRSIAMGYAPRAIGDRSTAIGDTTRAGGFASTAMGALATASGIQSTAMGNGTTASGNQSTAMGDRTTASGGASVAIGTQTFAKNSNSFAGGQGADAAGINGFSFGLQTFASGDNSVALGTRAVSAQPGSFTFADMSPGQFSTVGPNQFNVRATGGVGFFADITNPSRGAVLRPGDNFFSAESDVNAKHAFEALHDGDVLARLAAMPVVKWSYKEQDVRHLGPMAQDCHAAFGLGLDPLRLNPLDVSGVALAGVRALEARSRAHDAQSRTQADEITTLKEELARLQALVQALTASQR